MGSTLTLAVVEGRRLTVAHIGDSRAYLWRDGELRQLTEDHSVPGALLRQGKIEIDELYTHPHRNVLYRCLGLKPGVEVDQNAPLELQLGDGLLLCSDGLWDMVYPADRLAALVAAGGDPPAICRRLIDAANQAGGEDNVTAIWVHLVGEDG